MTADRPRAVPVAVAAMLDLAVIVVFAAIGRASHHETDPVIDAAGTAWAFLAGAVVGWAAVALTVREAPVRLAAAWPVWLCTVGIGMILRHVTGRGVAFSFVIVATVFLGVCLLGWRAIVFLWQRKAPA